MTPRQLLIRWTAMVVLVIASGLWQGKVLGTNLLCIAVLTATAMTGIVILYPLTDLPGLWGIGMTWLRHLLIFVIIAAVLLGSPLHTSIIMSIAYATLLTLYQMLW
ncbi:MAG: hypothetical protein M0R49_08995 [Limnochordia bacterium]|nr:hypothetical protein [Limnochordia bacterium]